MERDLQDIKEDVRTRSDIVDIISQYTRLKRSGKNWTGLCPFHDDKRPSFSVSPDKQYYKCWSCGEAGDVFKFIEKKENLEFIEALEFLARRAGITFERKGINKEQASERERMFEMNQIAAKFYQERLGRAADARDTLAKRGILKETQEHFDLGYAPPDRGALSSHLQNIHANIELAIKMGLVRSRQPSGSGIYDTFCNRLMFPIHDVSGRIVAFGGRAMGDDLAKYLNSDQSLVFDKSRTLYGLCFARKKLSSNTPAVFVEGYFDVITAHQAGFQQCVATLGTSLTEDHARILARYNPHVVICYDADTAGIKATMRGAEVWESLEIADTQVRIARLPAGEDPDSMLLKGDTAGFQRALDNAISRVEFEMELIQIRHDLNTETGKDAALHELLPVLAKIKSLVDRDKYAIRIARLHPASTYDLSRAIREILSDAAQIALKNVQNSPRTQGYPLTERANRAPLNGPQNGMGYQPPSKESWGTWPNTKQVVRKGNNPDFPGSPTSLSNSPIGLPIPPMHSIRLTGVEKAERELLRALLTAEWRIFILSRLKPEQLVTELGRDYFELIARTTAETDGSIDIPKLIYRVEQEELQPIDDPYAEEDSAVSSPADLNASEKIAQEAKYDPSKLSYFIRDVLEDSPFLVSNEMLSEASLNSCILKLQKHWKDQARRELELVLQQQEIPPEQRRAFIEQYHVKMRESHGSPLVKNE